MARIGKADHARILHMVDVEHRKVADIATEYGCSVANIYTLLGKLRRLARAGDKPSVAKQSEAAIDPAPDQGAAPAIDLFARAARREVPAAAARATADPVAPAAVPPAGPPRPVVVSDLPRKAPLADRGIGAARAKPGFGLVMRTAEGDDTTTPFRSLDDLLSTVKPILRAAARSPDAVWFSIQQIDLSMLDYDAA